MSAVAPDLLAATTAAGRRCDARYAEAGRLLGRGMTLLAVEYALEARADELEQRDLRDRFLANYDAWKERAL